MTKTFMLNYSLMMALLMILMIISISIIHPVPMISLMLIYNIILCMNMNMIKSNPLFPIMFFMIMTSGLLIIFLYFSSLISNEKNYNSMKKSIIITITLNSLYMLINSYYPNLFNCLINSNSLDSIMSTNYSMKMNSASYMYNSSLIYLTMMSMLFLLITLISVIKSCVPKMKTLRKIN